ncbi:MAG TPA: hypothetical protein VG871_18275, partial [Vicinamibacterales bacterium]|nr:hypothetical protein [Vicinamibacterales bacterium]
MAFATPIDASAITRAYLVKSEDEQNESARIDFDFNPISLSYSLEASTSQQNQPNRTGQSQSASTYSAKLSFDAIFDNTDTGEDIRNTTSKIAGFLRPSPGNASTQKSGASSPAVVVFHWGAFRFQGVLNQYKETIDFFSKDGVPLRSSLSLGMTEQGDPLPADSSTPSSTAMPSTVPTGSADSALAVATRGGNPGAARALAAANGLESLRSAPGVSLEIGGSARVSAAPSLVAASASADASAVMNT